MSAKLKQSATGPPPVRLILKPEVLDRTKLTNSAMYAAIGSGTFPRQVKISARKSAWLEHEVDQWIAKRVADRPQM